MNKQNTSSNMSSNPAGTSVLPQNGNASNSSTFRSKISSAHDWKTEQTGLKSPMQNDNYDAKKMMHMQLRSDLDSSDLSKMLNKPPSSQNGQYYTSKSVMETKLPEFLEGPILDQNKKPNDKNVELLNIELNKLSTGTNELELKKQLF
jgi:hypothetical protein